MCVFSWHARLTITSIRPHLCVVIPGPWLMIDRCQVLSCSLEDDMNIDITIWMYTVCRCMFVCLFLCELDISYAHTCVMCTYVERGSSALECRLSIERARPPLHFESLLFQFFGIFILFTMPQFNRLYKRIPGYYRQWWKYEWIFFAPNCCVARMLSREAELVPELTGLPGVWAVQWTGYCARYKTNLFIHLCSPVQHCFL